jgi:uncharacterized membrane protein
VGFRWTEGTGMQPVPMFEVTDISADGAFMIGLNVWRHTNGTAGTFGFLSNTNQYTAMRAVSVDAQVVVGYSEDNSRLARAVRWTPSGGLQDLGVTNGNESFCDGVSGDGLVAVGQARDQSGFWRAFRRTTTQSSLQDLGTLGGPMSAAYDASFDGAVIVGTSLISSSSASNRAFRWTGQTGMRNLKELLQQAGASSVDPYLLFTATAVSDDGRVIVGYDYPPSFAPPEPFVAVFTRGCDADFNGDGDVGTDQDIEAFFACLAGNCCLTCGSQDFDGDGDAGTDADIESFFSVLAGGAC